MLLSFELPSSMHVVEKEPQQNQSTRHTQNPGNHILHCFFSPPPECRAIELPIRLASHLTTLEEADRTGRVSFRKIFPRPPLTAERAGKLRLPRYNGPFMPQLLAGKTALVLGVANKWSIAYAIASAFVREGASLVLTYQR